MSSSNKNRKFKCPYCEKRLTRVDLVSHIDDNHQDMIPEGYTALRITFNCVNRKPIDYAPPCTECKKPCPWNENKGRYERQCGDPKCKESYLKKFEENMMRKRGVTRISSTPEGQEQMLARRRISGEYQFQNGKKKTYTGSYEMKTLEFMDKVMNIDPDDIMAPGPVLEYEYNNEKHFYITDFLYIPYNLIIEVKDGGSRPNNRNMPEYRAKQVEKERYIIKNTNYNYIRLTDNDLSQLLSVFMDLKMQLVDESNDRVIHINEAMNALMSGYIPGFDCDGSTYVVNYSQNNVFSGEEERGYCISDSPKLDSVFKRDRNGILRKTSNKFLENCRYDIYAVEVSPLEISNKISPYIDQFVSEGFLYETIFGKKMYTYDQIMTEKKAIPVVDFYTGMELLSQVTENYIRGNDKKGLMLVDENGLYGLGLNNKSDEPTTTYMNILNGKYRIESTSIPELYLETDDYKDSKSLEAIFLNCLSYKKGE